MEKVEVRELQNRLSHYVRRAHAGHAIQITDGGKVVAELQPPSPPVAGADAAQRLAEMARRGLVRTGAPNDRQIYRRLPPLLPPGAAKRLLDEERGER